MHTTQKVALDESLSAESLSRQSWLPQDSVKHVNNDTSSRRTKVQTLDSGIVSTAVSFGMDGQVYSLGMAGWRGGLEK